MAPWRKTPFPEARLALTKRNSNNPKMNPVQSSLRYAIRFVFTRAGSVSKESFAAPWRHRVLHALPRSQLSSVYRPLSQSRCPDGYPAPLQVQSRTSSEKKVTQSKQSIPLARAEIETIRPRAGQEWSMTCPLVQATLRIAGGKLDICRSD